MARIHPGFPISMPEILNKDVEVGEYVLPKGTNVSIDQYSLNHNSQYWSNPTKFQIQRYQNLDDFMSKWGMFRFGFGLPHLILPLCFPPPTLFSLNILPASNILET